MATTQLESGSFMVGMDCDCKSASMNRPLCAHMWKDPPRKTNKKEKDKKILYTFLTPINWSCSYIYGFFGHPIHSDFDQLSGNKRWIYIVHMFLTVSLVPALNFMLKALYSVGGLLCKSNAATADLGHAAHLHLAGGLRENWDVANKVFFFLQVFDCIDTHYSDSALALVNRKVKTWPERRVGALRFRYSKRTVRDFSEMMRRSGVRSYSFWQAKKWI